MFVPFFTALRDHGVPVSLREFLTFLQGVANGLVTYDIDGFYHLGRVTMVKDECHLDRYDRAFAASFAGLDNVPDAQVLQALDLPGDWLEKLAEKHLTPEQRAEIAALGGFDELMQTLRDRLAKQTSRHQGGSKWIGTAGTSPFGAHGYNPEGVRIGQDQSRHQRAVKVWDRREFRNLDGKVDLGTRNIKIALRALRQWARDGADQELDMDGTIQAIAHQGWLDVHTRPTRRNAVKVLLFLDIGGSMDPYMRQMEDLFSAAKSEFQSLQTFYFHNCLYDAVWRDNLRRWDQQVKTLDLMRLYGSDYKCIFVGDAAMAPYEITHPGGASEFWNAEPGAVWLARARDHWPHHVWINPAPETTWGHTPSTQLILRIFAGRMVPMTLDGLTRAIKQLRS